MWCPPLCMYGAHRAPRVCRGRKDSKGREVPRAHKGSRAPWVPRELRVRKVSPGPRETKVIPGKKERLVQLDHRENGAHRASGESRVFRAPRGFRGHRASRGPRETRVRTVSPCRLKTFTQHLRSWKQPFPPAPTARTWWRQTVNCTSGRNQTVDGPLSDSCRDHRGLRGSRVRKVSRAPRGSLAHRENRVSRGKRVIPAQPDHRGPREIPETSVRRAPRETRESRDHKESRAPKDPRDPQDRKVLRGRREIPVQPGPKDRKG